MTKHFQILSRATLALCLLFASLPLTACSKTVTLAQFAPYVRQSATAINNAVTDAWAAGIITNAQYEQAKTALAKYADFAPKAADYLASLQTLNGANKPETLRKLAEGVALGKQIALAAGLPANSTAARVIAAVVLGLETTASTIDAIKISDGSFGVAEIGAPSSVPASEIKTTLPKVDKDAAKYFRN